MSQRPNHARLESVDCLRGGAALAVVIHHAVRYGAAQPYDLWFRGGFKVLDLGHLGVPMFFVLSGFCIHLSWAKRYAAGASSEPAFIDFWKRRLYRLYPPYLTALCLSMALVLVAYQVRADVPLVTLYPEPRLRWMMFDFIAHLGMLHGLHPVFDKAGGNPPFWTLAREEYFYLMYFVLLAWRRVVGLKLTAGLVLLLGLTFPPAVATLLPAGSPWWRVVSTSAVVLWVQWCLGMVSAEAFLGIVRLPRCCSAPYFIPVWACFALVGDVNGSALSVPLWGMTFFTLLNACVAREVAGCWPQGRVARWLADVGLSSYSLYLIHNPVRAVTKQLLGPVAATTDPMFYLCNVALMILTSYFAGRLFFFWVERRFLFRGP